MGRTGTVGLKEDLEIDHHVGDGVQGRPDAGCIAAMLREEVRW